MQTGEHRTEERQLHPGHPYGFMADDPMRRYWFEEITMEAWEYDRELWIEAGGSADLFEEMIPRPDDPRTSPSPGP